MNFKRVISILLVVFFLCSNFVQVRALEESTIDIKEILLERNNSEEDNKESDKNISTKNIKITDDKILVEDIGKGLGEIIYHISDDDKNSIQKINSITIKFSHKLSTFAYKDENSDKYVLGVSHDKSEHQVKYLQNEEQYNGFKDGLFIKVGSDWQQCKLENGEYIFDKLDSDFSDYEKELRDYGVNIFVSKDGENFKRLKTKISVAKQSSNLDGEPETMRATDSYIETVKVGDIPENSKYIKIELNEKFSFDDVKDGAEDIGIFDNKFDPMMEVFKIDFEILKKDPKDEKSDEKNREDEENIKKQSSYNEEDLKTMLKRVDERRRSARLNEEKKLGESKVINTNTIRLGSSQNNTSLSSRSTSPKRAYRYYDSDDAMKKYKQNMKRLERLSRDMEKLSKDNDKYLSLDKNKKDVNKYLDIEKYNDKKYDEKNKSRQYTDSDHSYYDYDDDEKLSELQEKLDVNESKEDVEKDFKGNYEKKNIEKSKYRKASFDGDKNDVGNDKDDVDCDYTSDVLSDDDNLSVANLNQNNLAQSWSENLDKSIKDVEEKQVRAEKTVSKVYLSGLFMALTSILAYDKVGFLRKLIKF